MGVFEGLDSEGAGAEVASSFATPHPARTAMRLAEPIAENTVRAGAKRYFGEGIIAAISL